MPAYFATANAAVSDTFTSADNNDRTISLFRSSAHSLESAP